MLSELGSIAQLGAYGIVLVVLVAMQYVAARAFMNMMRKKDEQLDSVRMENAKLLEKQIEAQASNNKATFQLTQAIQDFRDNERLYAQELKQQIKESEENIKQHIDYRLVHQRRRDYESRD
jgi:tRNA G37 N-methylase Trm5